MAEKYCRENTDDMNHPKISLNQRQNTNDFHHDDRHYCEIENGKDCSNWIQNGTICSKHYINTNSTDNRYKDNELNTRENSADANQDTNTLSNSNSLLTDTDVHALLL